MLGDARRVLGLVVGRVLEAIENVRSALSRPPASKATTSEESIPPERNAPIGHVRDRRARRRP